MKSHLIFPHEEDDLTVSIPPRWIKLHKYFIVCPKTQPLDGVQLVQRERRMEQGRVVLLQVSWQKENNFKFTEPQCGSTCFCDPVWIREHLLSNKTFIHWGINQHYTRVKLTERYGDYNVISDKLLAIITLNHHRLCALCAGPVDTAHRLIVGH